MSFTIFLSWTANVTLSYHPPLPLVLFCDHTWRKLGGNGASRNNTSPCWLNKKQPMSMTFVGGQLKVRSCSVCSIWRTWQMQRNEFLPVFELLIRLPLFGLPLPSAACSSQYRISRQPWEGLRDFWIDGSGSQTDSSKGFHRVIGKRLYKQSSWSHFSTSAQSGCSCLFV